jgi:hypothetical protein
MGRDVADVDRLVQVDKFARLPQPVEELTEILFHGVLRRAVGQGAKLPGGGGLRQSFRCVGVGRQPCHFCTSSDMHAHDRYELA